MDNSKLMIHLHETHPKIVWGVELKSMMWNNPTCYRLCDPLSSHSYSTKCQ